MDETVSLSTKYYGADRRLPASMKTAESANESDEFAMPNWMVLTCPAITGAVSVSTTVRPSSSVSIFPKNGGLSRYRLQFWGLTLLAAPLAGPPQLMLAVETGTAPPGTRA